MNDFIGIYRKPLSVNECWQGKRFKTPKYEQYERDMLYLLPRITLPAPPYELHLEFGFSNAASDWDNPVKPFQDILQKKYGFNDKDVMKAVVTKKIVEKGFEYTAFKIMPLK